MRGDRHHHRGEKEEHKPRQDTHSHQHDHDREHGHRHDQSHEKDHKTRFHDPQHAAEFDKRSAMAGIRGALTAKLVEMMELRGHELVLDVATGTGRVARPVSKHLTSGRIIGVDQALAMLDVGRQHEDPISLYSQAAAEADKLPFKSHVFDSAFVSFSLHHFASPSAVVGEVLRVLKNAGAFFVLDPIINEAKDAVDVALEAKVNEVFRRTHGGDFRFQTANGIQRLLTKAGFQIGRARVVKHSFDQEGMEGVPTGPHWLEAAEELEKESPELAERMKESYFTWHRHGDSMHIKGSFSYALIRAQKPA
ncbi:MAG TPA: methyltransferase domain-containing protein [Terriglobales bacterium]|nr:methyltransferase domain-containing protein [Terriglobales bacterium]